MCLDSVSRTFPKNDKIRTGYKVFTRRHYGLDYHIFNPYFDVDASKKEGSMYSTPKESNGKYVQKALYRYGPYQRTCQTKGWYEEGFHIFVTIKGAERFMFISNANCIFEVIAWDIRALGAQNSYHSFVAKNYRIMREIKKAEIEGVVCV